jgi:Mg/Co/Ni transporter MgtE
VLLRALINKESEDGKMWAYVVGILTGIVMCMVAMLVRCVVWYGKKHPEDDYWHRITPKEEKDEGSG